MAQYNLQQAENSRQTAEVHKDIENMAVEGVTIPTSLTAIPDGSKNRIARQSLTPNNILKLQKTVGNKVVNRMIAHKLSSSTKTPKTRSATAQVNRKPINPKGVIQRAVGFEFEAVNLGNWTIQGQPTGTSSWRLIKDTKEILINTPNGKAGIGADNGHVEFITRPLRTWEEVTATFKELDTLVEELKENSAKEIAATTPHGYSKYKITTGGTAPKTKPQATIGVSALNIPDLFKKLVEVNKKKKGKAQNFEEVIASDTVAYAMENSVESAQNILAEAMQAAGKQFDSDESYDMLVKKEMEGFLTVVLKTLWDAHANSSAHLEDAKYAFPLMPRTDFYSMLQTLDPVGRDLLIELWNTGGNPLQTVFNTYYPLDAYVFPKGYKGADKKKQQGPTKRDWINSIIAGPKDLLSPPPGYPAHNTTPRPEGLGAYGDDDGRILFELRDLTGAGELEPGDWAGLVRAVCELVGNVQADSEDRNLIPED